MSTSVPAPAIAGGRWDQAPQGTVAIGGGGETFDAGVAEQSPARGWAGIVVLPVAVRLARCRAGAAKILDPSVGDDCLESWVVHVSTSVA
jgi:hypothetical protein